MLDHMFDSLNQKDFPQPSEEREAHRGGELLWRLFGGMMKLSTAISEPIRASAKAYFNEWSRFFHSELKTASQKSTHARPRRMIGQSWYESLPRQFLF